MARLVVRYLLATALFCSLYTGSAQLFPPAPTSQSANAPDDDSATAPGPGGAEVSSFSNIYDYISSENDFTSLVQLIDAAPSSADLLSILDAECGGPNSTAITFLAPTNDGIRRSLSAANPPQTLQSLLRNQNAVLQILMYHILPTPLPVTALKNTYSFNSILRNANSLPVSIAINNVPGQGITLVGSTNSARLEDNGVRVCEANPSIVYALEGLLIPGTVAGSAAAGVQSPPQASPSATSATGSASGAR